MKSKREKDSEVYSYFNKAAKGKRKFPGNNLVLRETFMYETAGHFQTTKQESYRDRNFITSEKLRTINIQTCCSSIKVK
jgi:hypothetical protein